ncbi:MAG: NusG domain II-containing protein, partial [Nitrospirota bacterium]
MTPADKVLFLLMILLSLAAVIFISSILPGGEAVEISADGKLRYVLPLDVDRTVSVRGEHGPTVVEIKGRRVRVIESPCPNKICIHQGWLEHGVIACVPNRVV